MFQIRMTVESTTSHRMYATLVCQRLDRQAHGEIGTVELTRDSDGKSYSMFFADEIGGTGEFPSFLVPGTQTRMGVENMVRNYFDAANKRDTYILSE